MGRRNPGREHRGRGWFEHPNEHRLARYGIHTKSQFIMPAAGSRKPSSFPLAILDQVNLANIIRYNKEGRERGNEWLAELDLVNGHMVVLDDLRWSAEIDTSYLHWDPGDEYDNVGYIHYHPPGIHGKFTAQDLVLGCILHNKRRNRHKSPYTYVVLSTDHYIIPVAIKPSTGRREQFEKYVHTDGSPATSKALNGIIKDMENKGELVRLSPVRLSRGAEVPTEIMI